MGKYFKQSLTFVNLLYLFLSLGNVIKGNTITTGSFSSPELKAQVSFSDLNLSVVVVNFSCFNLLFQNHWANFNQTWHQLYFDEGDSS